MTKSGTERKPGQRVQLGWLRPGMGVKRWLLLLLMGLAVLAVAVAAIPRAVNTPAMWAAIDRVRQWGTPTAQAVIGLAAGGLLVALAVLGLNRSLLSAFRPYQPDDVVDIVYRHRQRQRGPKVVAIGGGHGLNTLLRGLKAYTDNITAIVTVADDGGSSGRLRRDMGMLPPGDFRNCLAALSDSEGLVSQLFQYRFGDDTDLSGHSFGNLYLTAMTAITGSFEAALAESSRVLVVRGRVMPSTLAQVTLSAEVTLPPGVQGEVDNRIVQVRGESKITGAGGQIHRVFLDPEDPSAYPAAIRAILDADLVVAGPGSLYTSVLPNLLVPDLAAACAATPAARLYVCNVATQAGETTGYDVTDHVRALRDHVGGDLFETVLANHSFAGGKPPSVGVDWVHLPETDPADYQLVTRDLVDPEHPWRHDPDKLARSVMEFVNP